MMTLSTDLPVCKNCLPIICELFLYTEYLLKKAQYEFASQYDIITKQESDIILTGQEITTIQQRNTMVQKKHKVINSM